MATITKGGTLPDSSNKADFYALINSATISGIVNADIDAGAAIVDSKLAQIATASKVSGAAITALTSVPAGAGIIPVANIDVGTTANKIVQMTAAAKLPAVDGSLLTSLVASTQIVVGKFVRAMDAASGNVDVTTTGITPKVVLFFGGAGNFINIIFGASDGTQHYCCYNLGSTSPGYAGNVDGACIYLVEAAGTKMQSAVITSFASGKFTLTWIRTGATASGSATMWFVAIG